MSSTDNGNPSDTDKPKSEDTVSGDSVLGKSSSDETSSDESDSDNPTAGNPDEFLSAKAREVKRQIQEGRYTIDLNSLAQRLVDHGLLHDEPAVASELPLPQSCEAKNDEKPNDE